MTTQKHESSSLKKVKVSSNGNSTQHQTKDGARKYTTVKTEGGQKTRNKNGKSESRSSRQDKPVKTGSIEGKSSGERVQKPKTARRSTPGSKHPASTSQAGNKQQASNKVAQYKSLMDRLDIKPSAIEKLRESVLRILSTEYRESKLISSMIHNINMCEPDEAVLRNYALAKSYGLFNPLCIDDSIQEPLGDQITVQQHRVNLQAAALYTKADHVRVSDTYERDTYNIFFEQEIYNRNVNHGNVLTSNKTWDKVCKLLHIVFKDYKTNPDDVGFSNGASKGVVKRESSVFLKMTEGFKTCNQDVLYVHNEVMSRFPALAYNLGIPEYSRNLDAFIVGKEQMFGRVILMMNAVDVLMLKEDELALVKIYNSLTDASKLFDMPDLHKMRVGLIDENHMPIYASIDLKNGSQSLTTRHIEECIPSDIVDRWNRYTPRHVTWQGRDLHLQHYSSMGNPITFPLESIIFMMVALVGAMEHDNECKQLPRNLKAIRKYISKYGLTTFGDDILILRDYAQGAVKGLHNVGLRVNTTKTMIDKPCVESCGTDTVYGHYVRPIYYRNMELDSVSKYNTKNFVAYVSMCNFILELSYNLYGYISEGYHKLWLRYINRLPIEWRVFNNNEGTTALRYPSSYTPTKVGVYYAHNRPSRVFPNEYSEFLLMSILEGDTWRKLVASKGYESDFSYIASKGVDMYVKSYTGDWRKPDTIEWDYHTNLSFPHTVKVDDAMLVKNQQEIEQMQNIIANLQQQVALLSKRVNA